MRRVSHPMPGAMLLALALGSPLSIARAEESPLDPTPFLSASRSLAARGPVALALAAEPNSFRWGLELGFPLGLSSRDETGRLRPLLSPWRLDGFVHAAHDRQDVTRGPGFGYSLRLEHARARSAHWLGVSSGGSREHGEPETKLSLGAGRMQMLGGIEAEASRITSAVLFRDDMRWPRQRTFQYGTPADTGQLMLWRDSTVSEPGDHATIWNTAQASLRWQRGRLALASVGGISIGDGVRSRRWAQGTIELQVSRRILAMLSVGERPAPSLAFRSDALPRTMLGVQFAPWATKQWAMGAALRPMATEWRAQALPGDRLVVRVQCRDVASAEIAGDFTDWRPVALERLHGGRWFAVLRVAPGVHRVQLRLNGGPWLAPPGLPRADDGPAGPAGTLVVAPEE